MSAILTRRALLALLLVAILAQPLPTRANEAILCRWCSRLLAADSSSESTQRHHAHYAPHREADMLHLELDITPDFTKRTIEGVAKYRLKPIALPLAELKLQAENLAIRNVTASQPIRRWNYDDHDLVLTFDSPIPPDRETHIVIEYKAEPKQGLYFRTPEMGFKPEDTHLWTQGEPIESRHWFPCFDSPNEKLTSEVVCHVPSDMIVRSNGRLISSTAETATGRTAVRWHQDKPHAAYLIALVAGRFKGIEDRHKDVPLAFFTPASQAPLALNSFRDTRSMMEFFERETGVPYPWAKYDQVVVDDFTAGGMENTTLTILTDRTLFPNGYEPSRSSRGLVAHELAHQWFGDLVTCKDWSHLWLNEGFATYYDALQAREQLGQNEFLWTLYHSAKGVLNTTDGTPIVWRKFNHPMDQFGYRAYPKGAWVLHMLRSQVGDELYRKCITTYLQRHAYGVVETSDLFKVFEELSGRSFDRFADQWLHHGHHPELQIRYSWDEASKLAKFSIEQTQKLSDSVMLFDFPLPVRLATPAGAVETTLAIRARSEDFLIPAPASPDLVRIDPAYTVLAKIRFDVPDAMLDRQLRATNDLIGRLLAIESLENKQDQQSVDRLKTALNSDPFHGVRSEAAEALQKIHSDAAFQALTNSLDQPDPRVRAAVLRQLASFHRDEVGRLAESLIQKESHPAVRTAALQLLSRPGAANAVPQLFQALNTPSFRDELASAALDILRKSEDPSLIPQLLETLQRQLPAWGSEAAVNGLKTLAWLARNEDRKSSVRDFIAARTQHPRLPLRLAALRALGVLGDPQATAVLESFAHASPSSPEQPAAAEALRKIRESRRPAPELSDLREEVTQLQKANRDLKKDFEDLKKKFEAVLPTKAPSTNAPTSSATATPQK